jgi:hypothetical protein
MYEAKVPDNWEENSKSKRAATAKKVANDAMDHDKTDKIIPHVPKITEAAKDDDNDADNKPKAKKSDNDGDADNMDAKEIKGGKTDVDLNPKTDDKTEGENDDDKASKSAKNKANKDIGQKGVKEMHNPTKNFGLSDSLVEAVRKVMTSRVEEELKGGQKKLDKNHNGKLDKQDFKMLRNEEAVEEGNADNKAKKNAAVAAVGAKNKDSQYLNKMNPAVADKIRGREKMSGNDRKQFEEVEQVDELSNKTLYSYGAKAHNQVIKTGMGLTKKQGGLRTKGVSLEDGKRKMANRKAGVELAHKKAQSRANEEVVAEGPTSPVVKSKDKYDVSDMVAKFKAKGGAVTQGKTGAAYGAKVPKRTKAMREEVELSADEMARIEAIIAEIKL